MSVKDQIGFRGPDGRAYWKALEIFRRGGNPDAYLRRVFGRTGTVTAIPAVTVPTPTPEPDPVPELDSVQNRFLLRSGGGPGPGYGFGSVSGTRTEPVDEPGTGTGPKPDPDPGRCARCGEALSATRSTKSYCNVKCRVAAHRKRRRDAIASHEGSEHRAHTRVGLPRLDSRPEYGDIADSVVSPDRTDDESLVSKSPTTPLKGPERGRT